MNDVQSLVTEITTSEPKTLLKSKTFWGGVVALLATLGGFFGLQISGAEQDALVNGLVGVGGLVGFGLTIWGRLTATQPIKGTSAAKPTTAAMLLLCFGLVLGGLLLAPGAAWAGGADLMQLSLWPALVNLLYALACLVLLFGFWKLVDRRLLKRVDFFDGTIPSAILGGFAFLGCCLVVGLVLG